MRKQSIFLFMVGIFSYFFATANTPSPLPVPPEGISHQAWDELLNANVDARGKVNYKGFQAQKAKLEQYLKTLAQNPVQSHWNSKEQLVYWINAYNAFTVKLIVDNYPLKSIRDLDKPWDTAFITLGGKKYSLNQIENEIIRKQFDEPRIHFAVNCAAKSCPPLLNEAFTPAKLEAQLQKQTLAFVNNAKFNSFSAEGAQLSSIFDWYKVDFTKKTSLIGYLNKYLKTKVPEGTKVGYKNYDWSLNE